MTSNLRCAWNIKTETDDTDERKDKETFENLKIVLAQPASVWLSTWTYAFVMGGMNTSIDC